MAYGYLSDEQRDILNRQQNAADEWSQDDWEPVGSSMDDWEPVGASMDDWEPVANEEERDWIDDSWLGAVGGGFQKLWAGTKAAWNTSVGDLDDVVANAADLESANVTDDQKLFYDALAKRMEEGDEGILDGISNVAGAIWESPLGALDELGAQLPNMGVAMGGMMAGGAVGTAAGPVGTVVGGLIGLFAGNTLIETGFKATEKAKDKEFTEQERIDALSEGIIKGGVITSVDALSMGLSKLILGVPGKAVEQAVSKVLARNGVDVADKTAVAAAMADRNIAEQVVAAGGKAFTEATTKGKNIARGVGAFSNETFAEGIGEYAGELAATGEASATDAVLESLMSAPMSIGELAVVNKLKTGDTVTDAVTDNTGVDMTKPEEVQGFAKFQQDMRAAEEQAAAKALEPVSFNTTDIVQPYQSTADMDRLRPNPYTDAATSHPLPHVEREYKKVEALTRPIINEEILVQPQLQPTDAAMPVGQPALPATPHRAGLPAPINMGHAPVTTEGPTTRYGMRITEQGSLMVEGDPGAIRRDLKKAGIEAKGISTGEGVRFAKKFAQDVLQALRTPQPIQETEQEQMFDERGMPEQVKGEPPKDFGGPKGLDRIQDITFRAGLKNMTAELVEGGDIQYTYDENDRITGRTPSINPDWFQSGGYPSVKALRNAVDKALAGKRLGIRQQEWVEGMLDMLEMERVEGQDYVHETLAEENIDGIAQEYYESDWDTETRSIADLVVATENAGVDPEVVMNLLERNLSDAAIVRELTRLKENADGQKVQEGRKQDEAEDFQLETYTEEDIAKREAQKVEPEPEPEGEFTLTGSDREVDQREARGQTNLLDQIEKTETEEYIGLKFTEQFEIEPNPQSDTSFFVKNNPKEKLTDHFKVGDIIVKIDRNEAGGREVEYRVTELANDIEGDTDSAFMRLVRVEEGADFEILGAGQNETMSFVAVQNGKVIDHLWYTNGIEGYADGNEYQLIQRPGETFEEYDARVLKRSEEAVAGIDYKIDEEAEAAEDAFRDEFGNWDGFTVSEEYFTPTQGRVNLRKKEQTPPQVSQAEANKIIKGWKQAAKDAGKNEDNSNRVIISLFDATGEISKPWKDAGYQVVQYDLKLGDDIFKYPPVGQIQEIKDAGFEIVGVIAQPPCTCFAASGARWWNERHDPKDNDMVNAMFGPDAAEYFNEPKQYTKALVAMTDMLIGLAEPTQFTVLENPVGRIASEMGMPEATLKFEPHHFGDDYTKKTDFWGNFNPNLPTANVDPKQGSLMHKMWSRAEKDEGLRSLTPEGIAYAFFVANHKPVEQKAAEPGSPRAKGEAMFDKSYEDRLPAGEKKKFVDGYIAGLAGIAINDNMIEGKDLGLYSVANTIGRADARTKTFDLTGEENTIAFAENLEAEYDAKRGERQAEEQAKRDKKLKQFREQEKKDMARAEREAEERKAQEELERRTLQETDVVPKNGKPFATKGAAKSFQTKNGYSSYEIVEVGDSSGNTGYALRKPEAQETVSQQDAEMAAFMDNIDKQTEKKGRPLAKIKLVDKETVLDPEGNEIEIETRATAEELVAEQQQQLDMLEKLKECLG